ncbi:MAG: hypothetical protein HQK63_06280 [Desulfamplus sp.]|nr:hypothetical protein [Desulfamplus sp.]
MQKYADINGDSGVYGFEIQTSAITVWFKGTQRPYTYSYQSAGQSNVEEMKRLALSGNGLNAFINRNVKFDYVR